MKNYLGKFWVMSLLLLLSSIGAWAQSNAVASAKEKLKEYQAREAFYNGDFSNALKQFKLLQSQYPQDANVAYWVGESYFNLNDFESAKVAFEKAISIKPLLNANLYLDLGKSYLSLAQVEPAIKAFNQFTALAGTGKEYKESDVAHYIGQCNVAKELMAHPVNVKISNLGEKINSIYDDKRPSLTADGKKMIFTSRRPKDKNSRIDREGDGKYFEDIYFSNWDSVGKTWSAPELLPGGINTEYHDAACSISPDGKQIFVYKNDPKLAKGGDIWVSKLNASGKWGAARPITAPVNTSYWEDGACLSPDGNTLYFISEMQIKGAQGKGDIYYCTKDTKTGVWNNPVNIGPAINTPYDEGGVFAAADGKTLFFCSEGHNSMGSYDIFKTVYENGKWSTPMNVGYPINTTGAEKSFILTTDGKVGYLASDRTGGYGERDIYAVDLSNYPLLTHAEAAVSASTGAPQSAIFKGAVISSDGAKGVGANIQILNNQQEKVGETRSNEEDGGAFFTTLFTNQVYTVVVEHDGFEIYKENIFIPNTKDGSTNTLIKDIILLKK